MSKLGNTRIVLWVMAALVAVVMGFGASEAQAHSGHEHGHHAAAISSSLIPTHLEGLAGREAVHAAKLRPQPAPIVVATESGLPNSHGSSDACGCCAGPSCCSVVCLNAISHQVVPPPALATTLALPSGLSPVGIDPSALLRPPRPFA
ncbi:hypothetical protein [Rhodoblastus sp.]|uniref:hypothetical protein n=1 Tax=Rhodoblastus sp. TaxID=1962975 RepID=UPI0035B4CF93